MLEFAVGDLVDFVGSAVLDEMPERDKDSPTSYVLSLASSCLGTADSCTRTPMPPKKPKLTHPNIAASVVED